MSWYGRHSRFPKAKIVAMLPPASCKLCIYWFRCAVGSSPDSWYQEYQLCPRCGIAQWKLLAELNRRLLELSTPHQPRNREPIATTPAPHHPPTGKPRLDKWLALCQSTTPDIRIRAAASLIRRPDTPLPIMLDLLDNPGYRILGSATEKALLIRRDPALVNAMIARLDSNDTYIREVACNMLGNSNDKRATPHLLRMLDDSDMMVRRAAGFALAHIKDTSSIPELKRQYERHRKDDINVRAALDCALRELGVETDGF